MQPVRRYGDAGRPRADLDLSRDLADGRGDDRDAARLTDLDAAAEILRQRRDGRLIDVNRNDVLVTVRSPNSPDRSRPAIATSSRR